MKYTLKDYKLALRLKMDEAWESYRRYLGVENSAASNYWKGVAVGLEQALILAEEVA